MRRFVLSLLFLLPALSSVRSQSLYFDRIDIKDGLSQNTVNEIIQDSRGFIWFATNDGLNRYDGSHFKVFRHLPYGRSGLGNNTIRCLVEDADNNIWVGTNSGLYVYDTEYDRFSEVEILDSGGGNDRQSDTRP